MRQKSIAIIFVLVAAGCSSLEVKVSIAEPSIGRAAFDAARLRNELPEVLAQSPKDIELTILKLNRAHRDYWLELRAEYDKQIQATPAGDKRDFLTAARDALDDDLLEEISRVYTARQSALVAIAQALRALCPTAEGCAAKDMDRVKRWSVSVVFISPHCSPSSAMT